MYADDLIRPIPVSVVEEVDPQGQLLQAYAGELPVKLAIPVPTDPESASDYILQRIRGATPLHLHTADYVRLVDWWPQVIADSLDVERYVTRKEEWQLAFLKKLATLQRPVTELVFLPIKGRNKSGIIVADAATAEFIDFLDIPFVPEWGRRKVTLQQRLDRIRASMTPAEQQPGAAPE